MRDFIKITQSDVGVNLRLLRQSRGLTLKDMADKLSLLTGDTISAGAVGYWERGERNMSASDVAACAQVLNTSIESLFFFKDSNLGDIDIRRFISSFKALSMDDKRVLAYMLSLWPGDPHVLLSLCHMYMACSAHDQGDMCGMAALFYRRLVKAGKIDEVLGAADLDALEAAWGELIRR